MIIYPLVPWKSTILYKVTITGETRSQDELTMGEAYTFGFSTSENP